MYSISSTSRPKYFLTSILSPCRKSVLSNSSFVIVFTFSCFVGELLFGGVGVQALGTFAHEVFARGDGEGGAGGVADEVAAGGAGDGIRLGGWLHGN